MLLKQFYTNEKHVDSLNHSGEVAEEAPGVVIEIDVDLSSEENRDIVTETIYLKADA